MKAILIGDRLTCAGYRLAGIDARTVPPEQAGAAFDDACDAADLVLITAPLAGMLDDDQLAIAMRRAAPPVQVVPPATDPRKAPDVRAQIRRSLGVSE